MFTKRLGATDTVLVETERGMRPTGVAGPRGGSDEEGSLKIGLIGKAHSGGEVVLAEDDRRDSVYVVQEGRVEIVHELDEGRVRVEVLGEGDLFGEAALCAVGDSGTLVRALGRARVLTVDKRLLLTELSNDSTLALPLVERMNRRIGRLRADLARSRRGAS